MMFSFLIDDEEALFIDDDYLKDENQSENELFYSFADFEHVLQFAKRIQTNFDGGKLYYYNQLYYVLFPSGEIKDKKRLTSIVSEYGERSLDSPSMIQEYGKIILNRMPYGI